MNGVPNSPPNRYNQVVDSYMENNIIINSDYIQLYAGSDEERSAVPVGTTFKNNLIMGSYNLNPFTIYDDVSGIKFHGNIVNEEVTIPLKEGFEKVPLELSKNTNNLLTPTKELADRLGFENIALPISKEDVGANYYQKGMSAQATYNKTIVVPSGTNTLLDALVSCQSGDTLQLESGGTYLLTKYALVNHPIVIITPYCYHHS